MRRSRGVIMLCAELLCLRGREKSVRPFSFRAFRERLRLSRWESSRQSRVRGLYAPFAYFRPLPSRRRLQTLTHLQIPLPSRRRLQTLAHLQIPLRCTSCATALFDENINLAQTNNRSFFCLLFFSKKSRSGGGAIKQGENQPV